MTGQDALTPGAGGDQRFTVGFVLDVLDVLERGGYHCTDDLHTVRAVGMPGDIARTYEGGRHQGEQPLSHRPSIRPDPQQQGG